MSDLYDQCVSFVKRSCYLKEMNRRELVLAALSTSRGGPWTPVQVQKLFFVLDERVAAHLGGKHWGFVPYDYGPFDSDVYSELEAMAREGLVIVQKPTGGVKEFRLTQAGQDRGNALLGTLASDVRTYVQQLGDWIRSLSFKQLVSAIYRDFPAMKANSVFRE